MKTVKIFGKTCVWRISPYSPKDVARAFYNTNNANIIKINVYIYSIFL